MLAKELIDRLERLGLLDQEIIEALREQLEQGGTRVTPEAVAKLLVDNGQLTHFQATKLIGELRSGDYQDDPASSEEADLTAGLDDLGIAPEAGDDALGEPVAVEVVAAEAADAIPVVAEAVPAEAVPVSAADVMSQPVSTADRPRNITRKKPAPEKSVWDSFKIYGYVGIIVLLVLLGLGLVFVLNRESADDYIARGNELYDNQNYSAAQETYLGFLDTFGESHQYSSLSRTRVAMTNLYRAAEFRNDPGRALEIEREQLPIIERENEEGLNEERGNLAQLLVDVAKNISEAAVEESDTEEKRDLLDKLDQQIEFTNNPIYMTASARATLAGQIDEVMEARKRVQRDINRNVSLDDAVVRMGDALQNKETKQAFDICSRLLRDYPELFDNERLEELIVSASDIQQTLVAPSTKLPVVTTDSPESESIRSIVLTNLTGGVAPDLSGETLYLRAGGSILAFDGENGKLKWRKFVGSAKNLPPVRLGNGSGVILSESATLEVLRCSPDDGAVTWRSKIDDSFAEPVSVRDDVFVSTQSGQLIKIDAESGQADWVTQIPQPLEVGPGVDDRADRAYLPGNHSNLYLINTRDGSCQESFYIGHAEGTIAVPPIPLLGHVFVIENAGAGYVNVHVLKVNDQGDQIEVAQPLFRMEGNVTEPPLVQGRRLIVLTDRGEVAVYDIEPTAEKSKVTIAATGPAFYDEPTTTQMAVEGSQMWITGASVGRYELQINTGRVVRDWDHYPNDTFIGKPMATDDTLVHARVLRGTETIRVTAADPKTGKEIWRTDVGVPVSMVRSAPGNVFHAVTSQAALFQLDLEALASGSTQGPIENPGDAAILILFADPLAIDDTRRLLINQAASDKILVYDPSRPREWLRQVTLNVSGGELSGGAIVSGGGLFMPLSSGRAVLVDWRTGSSKATPFQPDSDPAETVNWTDVVALPDDPTQIVIADSRKKIYRIRVGEQLRALASKDLEQELLGPAAGVGNTFVASLSGPAADFVVGYDLGGLDEKFRSLLNGRITWGPVAAGDVCLLRTDDSMLRAFSEDGTQKFEVQLPAGMPVGKPVVVNQSIVLAGADGWLVAIDAGSGQLLGQTDLGQPISATPLLAGGKSLLVPGAEGVVYIVDVPSTP
jgi:outer membrane protein assembly factor BamB